MISAPLFCTHCGAANVAQAAFCYACGQAISTPGNAFAATHASGPLQVGELLKARYQITQQIGTGGFGAVYQAEDVDLGKRLVAVKEMSQHNLSRQEIAEATHAFKQEALLLAGLMHEHLPRIYDHFSEGGRWYLVMDYIRGETLEDLLEQAPGGQLDLDEALRIALQLGDVLDYLHTRQPPIVFRDLKPSNVILTPEKRLFLIDFGIARHFKPGQAKDTIAFGSPGYAPPEQYGKAQTTPRADIYALGAILHQMVSGTDPSLAPFRFAPLTIDAPALQQLLERMLALDESQRPASMAEVQQELQWIKEQPHNMLQGQAMPPIMVLSPLYKAQQPVSSLSPLPQSQQPGLGLPPLLQPSQVGSHFSPLLHPRVTQITEGPDFLIYEGHISPVHSVAWSPDSAYVASASAEVVRVWDAMTGNEVCTYQEHLASVVALAWAPGTMHIASLSQDNNLRIWNAKSGNTVESNAGALFSQAGVMRQLAWSPNARLLAAAGDSGPIQIFDMFAHQLVDTLPLQGYNALSWSPDGRLLALADGKAVSIWSFNAKTVHFTRHYPEPVNAVAWSPDNDLIAFTSKANPIEIWQIHTKKQTHSFVGRQVSHANTLAWSLNGKVLFSGDENGAIQTWDTRTGDQLKMYNGHKNSILSLAWSPNGRYLASGGKDAAVHIWGFGYLYSLK